MPINYLKKIQLGEFNKEGYRISPSTVLDSVIEGFYVFSRDLQDKTLLVFNDGFPVLVFLQNSEDTITVTGEMIPSKLKLHGQVPAQLRIDMLITIMLRSRFL
jgi:hypothetical protein